MTVSTSKPAAGAAAAGLLLLLAGCGVHQPDDAATLPAPPAETYAPPPPADLAGAPPSARPADGLAGGPPAAYRAPPPVSMAPIANPEDMSAEERHRVYGGKYDRHLRGARPARAHHRAAPRAHAAHAAAPHAAAKPVARPVVAPRPTAPHAAKAPAPKAVAPAPKPPVAARPPAPAIKPAAPAPALKPPAPTAAAPLDAKTAQLQTALGTPVVAGSTLTTAPDIAKGAPGQVALSLPPNLLDLIRQQAAKVGLGRAGRSAEVTATLSGTGYDIAPSAAQTARLAPGVGPHFLWNVTPQPGVAHSPLHADVQAALTGERKPRTFPLASFEQPGAQAGNGDDSDKMRIGGLDGSSRTVLGVALILGALIVLLVFANRALSEQARKRERRAAEARAAREAELREFEAHEARMRAKSAAQHPPAEPNDTDQV